MLQKWNTELAVNLVAIGAGIYLKCNWAEFLEVDDGGAWKGKCTKVLFEEF